MMASGPSASCLKVHPLLNLDPLNSVQFSQSLKYLLPTSEWNSYTPTKQTNYRDQLKAEKPNSLWKGWYQLGSARIMLNNKTLPKLSFLKERLLVLLDLRVGWGSSPRLGFVGHQQPWTRLGLAPYVFLPGCRGSSYPEKVHLTEMAEWREHAQSHKCFPAFDHIRSLNIRWTKANSKATPETKGQGSMLCPWG